MECLKFMKDVFTMAFRLVLKQYYQNSHQLIKKYYSLNHALLRLIENWKKSRDNKYFVVLLLWISPWVFSVFLTIYLPQNFMHMV